jgi:uncharacterized protein
MTDAPTQIPHVDYLVLGDRPHLVANECSACKARYFDRRNAVIDCDGTSVRGNVINTPADPANISLGMKVRLATYVIGADTNGTEAIGYGFEPVA